MKIFYYLLFALITAVVVFPYFPPFDMDNMRFFFIGLAGMITIASFALLSKINIYNIMLLPFFAYVFIRGLFGFTGGYTVYEMIFYISIYGIILLASEVEEKIVWAAFLFMALAQLFFTYVCPIQYAMEIKDQHTGAWGTVRHAIRFSTVIYCGILAAWKLFVMEKGTVKNIIGVLLLLLLLGSLWVPYSNTILFITALTMILLIGHRTKWVAGLGLFALAVFYYSFTHPQGFELDSFRNQVWHSAIDNTKGLAVAFGHGVSSWVLNCGNIGWDNLGHPHNEVLKIYYELGLVGIILFYTIIMAYLVFSIGNVLIVVGMAGFIGSTFTNSLFGYPEVSFMFALFMGMAVRNAQIKYS